MNAQIQQPAPAGSLRASLQTPGLREQRNELEARLRNVPIDSQEFRKLREELFQLNQKIQKAQAQDDLLIWQAMANLGLAV